MVQFSTFQAKATINLYEHLLYSHFYQHLHEHSYDQLHVHLDELQGVDKYFRILQYHKSVVTCESCNKFTNHLFLLKTEIHAQILNTEPFLCI